MRRSRGKCGIGVVEDYDGGLRADGSRWWGSVWSRASTVICVRLGPVVEIGVVEGLDGDLRAAGSRWWRSVWSRASTVICERLEAGGGDRCGRGPQR